MGVTGVGCCPRAGWVLCNAQSFAFVQLMFIFKNVHLQDKSVAKTNEWEHFRYKCTCYTTGVTLLALLDAPLLVLSE
jgi:hypothetical protein